MHVLVELPFGEDGEEITFQVNYKLEMTREIEMTEVLQYNNQEPIDWLVFSKENQYYMQRMCEENYIEDHLT